MAHHHVSELAAHVAAYAAAYGTTSAEHLDHLYERRALLVPRPGHPVSGPDRVAANRHMLAMGATMQATMRHAYVVDDLALLVVDWTMSGEGVRFDGTATDVVRRGQDGRWRYVIDNPFGTAPET